MAETYTSRLGLIKPARDTLTPLDVNQLNENADTIDAALGATQVVPDTTPPAAELYDGKIIREKTSNKVWIAERQTNGSYLKRWTHYPWSAKTVNRNAGIGVFTNTWQEVLCPEYLSANSRNAPEATTLVDGGRLVVPVAGFYLVHFGITWRPYSTVQNINDRILGLGINGSATSHSYTEDARVRVNLGNPGPPSLPETYQRHSVPITLQAGSKVSVFAWHSSTAQPLAIDDAFITATLIVPMPEAV